MLGEVDLMLAEDEVITEEASLSRDPFTTAETVCCCIMPGGEGGESEGAGDYIHVETERGRCMAAGAGFCVVSERCEPSRLGRLISQQHVRERLRAEGCYRSGGSN